jgi:lipoprotein signal peptidase
VRFGGRVRPDLTRSVIGVVSLMGTGRESFRYPVDLNAWVHAAERSPAPARVVNLSRTGAGLWLARPGQDFGMREGGLARVPARDLDVGSSVGLAFAHVIKGHPMIGPWLGRVAHVGRASDDLCRVGLAFDDPLSTSSPGTAGLPWSLSVLLSDAVVTAGPRALVPRIDALTAGVALAGLAADQASKAWAWSDAVSAAAGGVLDLVPNVLAVVPSANAGTVASLADGLPLTARLCAVGALTLAALAPSWTARLPGPGVPAPYAPAIGSGLLVAGLVGNATDRLALGYVRDFLVSGLFPQWAFNLADVFLLLGALTLLGARLRPGSTRSHR